LKLIIVCGLLAANPFSTMALSDVESTAVSTIEGRTYTI
jgi:hypothetical protein